MTLKEEVKDIYNNRPKREPKDGRKEAKDGSKHAKKRSYFPKKKRYLIILIIMGLISAAFLVALTLMDALPGDLTTILIAIMGVSLIVCCLLFSSEKRSRHVIGVVLALIFIVFFSFITNFIGNTYAMLASISDTDTMATGPQAKTVNVAEEGFNLYITGIDQWADEKGLDLERSDVNMIVTVNPVTKKILLTSIPRDTYVELYTAKQMDKLTHTGIYGVDETLNTVSKWLGVDINYYVKMNFTGARMIIDSIGGVDVYSPVEFMSIRGYEYKKGWNHLTGKEALYFARERKAFEGQDAMRVENQQRVMKAVIKKMTSSTTLLTHYGDIMDAAGEQLQTNLTKEEMTTLAKMQITDLASWDVQSQKIEGEVDQDYVASLTQAQKFDIYRPSEESVKSCTKNIEAVLNPTEEEIEEATKGSTRSFLINAAKRALTKKEAEEDEDAA